MGCYSGNHHGAKGYDAGPFPDYLTWANAQRGESSTSDPGLEAVYSETRMQRLPTYLASLLHPVQSPQRTFEMEHRSDMIPHLTTVADTGNKTKKLRIREGFEPVENIKPRIRIPRARSVKRGSLLPRVFIDEAVRVDLA